MKILGTITESDVFPDQVPTPSDQYGELRKAVRIILLDDKGKVALGYYPPKPPDYPNGDYNLPGGGVKEGESILDALARETLEEVGCRIKNIKEVGIIKESGVGKKVKRNQDTYCFAAEVDGGKGQPQFTESEKRDLLEVRWLPLNKAIDEISKRDPSFSRTRDLICLGSLKEYSSYKFS